jgi:hypothetical protein
MTPLDTLLDFLTDPTTGMLCAGYGLLQVYLALPSLRRRYRRWCRRVEWQRTPL